MFKILRKEALHDTVTLMEIEAPYVAHRAQPGQFLILRIDDKGERIPLTIAGFDPKLGTVTIIFQKVGYTTCRLDALKAGDALRDVVGPLGEPSHLDGLQRVAVIGGGLGVAIAYPQAKALHEKGAYVEAIVGFRTHSLVILEDMMLSACSKLTLMTDDGTYGRKGFVTQALAQALEGGQAYDAVIAIGPLPMMKAVCEVTRPHHIKTIVSMNSIMIDGTGMCGGCRVTVGGETKFACVDGPDFDGHLVDFDEAIRRGRTYRDQEEAAMHQPGCPWNQP